MAKSRLQKTLADYMVIAITPALIMLLVGSLVFFLLAIGYDGRFSERLHWILAWFVLAIVLVARIAIEQGPQHARIYGLALAIATSLVIFRFVDSPWIVIPLLALIWWCANKLTWDSTLVDDGEDASGEGLLQHAGLDENTADSTNDRQTQPDEPDDDTPSERLPKTLHNTSKKKTHTPGVWVVYFSLFALPLFGFGQMLIPPTNEAGRDSAFRLLFVYVASGLALLLTTSFLGLRRYLRQRRIQMPAPISAIWLAMGSAIILSILVVCILLPRPNATYSATAFLDRIAEREQEASRHAQMGGDGAEGEGRRIGDEEDANEEAPADENAENEGNAENPEPGDGEGRPPQQDAEPGNAQQNGEQTQAGEEGEQAEEGENAESEEGQPGDDDSEEGESGEGGERESGENQPGEGEEGAEQQLDEDGENSADESAETSLPEEQSPEVSPPSMSQITGWLATVGKWLIYGLIAAMLLWYMIRHRAALLESLRQMYLWLLGLFGLAGGDTETEAEAVDTLEAARTTRPFASFENPFHTGRAARMKPQTIVVYTFEALQAWAREQGIERTGDQTPLEFVKTVADQFPGMSSEVTQAGRIYAEVAYASGSPSRGKVDRLEVLWNALSRTGAAAEHPMAAR